MTNRNIIAARHRADARPTTFLSDLSGGAVVRRGAAGLAGAGLALGLLAPGASAFDPGPSPEPAASTEAAGGTTHTVAAGDTVARIAQQYGGSVSGIIEANGLGADALIFPGDELTVPGSASEVSSGTVENVSGGGEETVVQQASTAAGSGLLDIARQHVGTPYVWGGSAPGGFDCSGFTQHVFAQVGIDLPRSTDAQRSAGTQIPASEARPGDLVWWPGHVGIYTGDGNHIAARNPGTPLHESPIHMDDPTFIRVT